MSTMDTNFALDMEREERRAAGCPWRRYFARHFDFALYGLLWSLVSGEVNIADGNTLDEQIAADERRQRIEKEIAKLEKQARAEKQPKKKFELVQRVRALQKQLDVL